MTPFILICAAMLMAAVALVVLPLVRNVPAVAKGEPVAPRATAATVALVIALPLAAAALYASLSNFPWDNPQAAAAAPPGHGTSGGGDAGSMEEVTKKLEARLAENPQDVEGWRMLGRTYLVSGDAVKAVTAYTKADEISGGKDLDLRLDLAEALVLSDDPAAQGKAKEIIDGALATDALNQKALWYSGVIAARANDKETAKLRWTKLLETDPPPEIRQILVAQLEAIGAEVPALAAAAATEPAMGSGMGGSAPAGDATTVGRTVRVALSIDPALAGKLKPGTPLFVSARQPGIPGPPLAAVRISADELPTTVVLSDANSMIEGRNLSSVDEVQLVARVAFGGTAVVASGDLVGEASHKKGAAPEVSIVISKVTP